jgi:hypothetical protein
MRRARRVTYADVPRANQVSGIHVHEPKFMNGAGIAYPVTISSIPSFPDNARAHKITNGTRFKERLVACRPNHSFH